MPSVSVSGVETVETHWLPMSDGRRLAARLFLPEGSAQNPVPLILEYIPYRRRDGTRTGDEEMHRWFAAHGFACARVDIAGTGDSDGIVEDEYVKREQDDALEIIEHLAAQKWCTGAVGMIGISWGGFSGLQAAARRPPQLKAIVTICSTDDRYACDAHYNGGCLINDNFGWGGALFNYAALPPDPAVVGEDRWRDLWRQRLEAHHLFPATWLRHQRRDDFWKHGSVCEDYAAIKCPVLAVGGWLDGYTQTIFRLVENLSAPVKGICGPWGHKEPQSGIPGPAIGFLQECVRWFGFWLRGDENGAGDEAQMRLFLMDPRPPATHQVERPGRWLGFSRWPAQGSGQTIGVQRLFLGAGTLLSERTEADAGVRIVSSPPTTGLRAQEWCPYGQGRIAAESATDQREDDAGSILFDTAPLVQDLAIVGRARAKLRLAADRTQAMAAVRLTSVAPDGTSALVSFALLNLSHRGGHEAPSALVPGAFEIVEFLLKPVGQVVPAGHRLRLAVSSSYWPMAWPAPETVTLSIDPAGSDLDLPLLHDEGGLVPVAFEEALWAEPGPVTVKEKARQLRSITVDVPTERTVVSALSDDGRYVLEETGTEVATWRRKEYAITRDDLCSCTSTITSHEELNRPDWRARVDSAFTVSCDASTFRLSGWLKAYDDDVLFAERRYDETIPRDFM